MFKIKVMDFMSAFQYVYNHAGYEKGKHFAVLSIQEYPFELMGVEYKVGGNCLAALNVHFSDITNQMEEQIRKEKKNWGNEIKLIEDSDANEIKQFVESLFSLNIDTLIIHCHAGVSRSSAVAAAITKYYTNDDSIYFNSDRFAPNMTVYYKVLKAFGMDNTPSFDTFLE